IDIEYFDGVATAHSLRDVQGLGILPAVLEISDGPIYSFGSIIVGQTPTKIFTITNTGGLPATGMFVGGFAAPYTFTGFTYPGLGGDCGATLNPGSTCQIEIQFSPLV